MKTAVTDRADWRRVGKSKPRCIVIGANNGHGGGFTGSLGDTVRPLNTYPQAYGAQVDEEDHTEQGHDVPGVEDMAMRQEKRAVKAVPDVKSITEIERDRDVKEMETSSITTATKPGRYGTVARAGNNRDKDEKAPRGGRGAKNADARRRGRDLHGGMELLGVDFLLEMVENIDGTEEHDITMRKLSIHELMRTTRINEVDSSVLKFYCLDEDSLYGREIQCEAMKELAERTRQSRSI